MTRAYLESLGYRVLEAADGAEAIARSSEYPGRIDLVLTDLYMAKRRGDSAFEAIRRDRPGTKAIFISGYLDDQIAGEPENMLRKPFALPELGRRVRSVLDIHDPKAAFWATAVHITGESVGVSSELMNTAGILGGIVSTSLVPVLVQHFGWIVALASGAVVALACTAAWIVMGRIGFGTTVPEYTFQSAGPSTGPVPEEKAAPPTVYAKACVTPKHSTTHGFLAHSMKAPSKSLGKPLDSTFTRSSRARNQLSSSHPDCLLVGLTSEISFERIWGAQAQISATRISHCIGPSASIDVRQKGIANTIV